jgi:predicted phosphoribosyltransferase
MQIIVPGAVRVHLSVESTNEHMDFFLDRLDAGMQLAEKLKKHRGQNCVVLAVPRGGVVVAYAVAKKLHLPLDLILAKKIGHPLHPEYAIGAVSLTDSIVLPHEGVSETYIKRETERIRTRLAEMQQTYRAGKPMRDVRGKTVIVVDDGVATGHTLIATIHLLKKEKPARIVIAVPVAPRGAFQQLSKQADEVVCLFIPRDFHGVGAFYNDFAQVTDGEVLQYLNYLHSEKTNVSS